MDISDNDPGWAFGTVVKMPPEMPSFIGGPMLSPGPPTSEPVFH